jgi:hypothetical protein
MSDERAAYYFERQNLAYAGPSGTWAQRWLPFVCRHATVRCTHGDEIIHRRWRRRVCMVCGRALRGPLPALCFFTEQLHRTARRPLSAAGVDGAE